MCGLRADGTCDEQNKLGAVFFSKADSEEKVFLKARDMAAELCEDILHKSPDFVSAEPDFDFEHPVNSFEIEVDGEKIGYLSVPHPTVLENIDKKCAVAFVEIFTEKFAKAQVGSLKYREPSKFPAIDIDLTFTADIGSVSFSSLEKAAREVCGEMLASVSFKDLYTADGASSLTLRFSFVSNERTLTKQELVPLTDAIIKCYASFGLEMKL